MEHCPQSHLVTVPAYSSCAEIVSAVNTSSNEKLIYISEYFQTVMDEFSPTEILNHPNSLLTYEKYYFSPSIRITVPLRNP